MSTIITLEEAVVQANDLDEVRALLPQYPEEHIQQCAHCADIDHTDDLYYTERNGWVCEDCLRDNYTECYRCHEYEHDNYTSRVEGEEWCSDCYHNHSTWCDECDEAVAIDGAHYENHERRCDCEAPNQNFSLPVYDGPMIGYVRLNAEQTYEITSGGGQVRNEGVWNINSLLTSSLGPIPHWDRRDDTYAEYLQASGEYTATRNCLWAAVEAIGPDYKNAEGGYVKRLRRMVHKKLTSARKDGVKIWADVTITDETYAKIGQIAKEYSTPLDHKVVFTRHLNQDAEVFGHGDSCWWTDYDRARCVLKQNHGFGLLSVEENPRWGGKQTVGRVWVYPCKVAEEEGMSYGVSHSVRPTADENPDAYLVFNGYGDLSERVGPQVVADMFGMKVHKDRTDFPDSDMYINADPYLIVPEDMTDKTFRIVGRFYGC